MIEEMRKLCRKCLKHVKTKVIEVSDGNTSFYLHHLLLSAVGFGEIK
jgi:hypothetical protein